MTDEPLNISEETKKLVEEVERMKRLHILLNPEELHMLNSALLAGSMLLPIADAIYEDATMDKAEKIAQVYMGINVLNLVQGAVMDDIDIKDVSPNVMLDSILEQITEASRKLYPYLNDEEKATLVEDHDKLSKQLNDYFAEQAREDLTSDEAVMEAVKDDPTKIDEAVESLATKGSELVDKALKEVTRSE